MIGEKAPHVSKHLRKTFRSAKNLPFWIRSAEALPVFARKHFASSCRTWHSKCRVNPFDSTLKLWATAGKPWATASALLLATGSLVPALGQATAAPQAVPQTSLEGNQVSGVNQTGFPEAPSSLRGPQSGLQRPAGSGVTFTPPATSTGPGGVAIERPTDRPLPLTLDDAISLALVRNVRMRYDKGTQDIVKGYQYQVTNALLPNFTVSGSSSTQEINLAAMGFKPQSLGPLLAQLGGATIPSIVKVNVTQAQVSTTQRLFDLPALELYLAAKREFRAVDLTVLNDRGEVIQAVGQAYLKILADQANLANATGQVATAQTSFDQAAAKRDAGVGTNLDALRAQVTLQQRQQDRIASDAQLDKDGIQLNRIMGLPAGQQLDLTENAPFATLEGLSLDQAKAVAYESRKDLLGLQANIDVASRELRAIKYQRLPTVAFNGYYGVLGETTGLYHGVFRAVGSVNFPIFREAGQRGEEQQVSGQLINLRQREADLRVTIDAQIRSAMLDVQSSRKVAEVAQSNVELSRQELADERERFAAGVDDNLPLVNAQASVTGSEAQLVQSLYQYNVSKLALARATGIIESRYRTFLGR